MRPSHSLPKVDLHTMKTSIRYFSAASYMTVLLAAQTLQRSPSSPSSYVLGPDDQVIIRVLDGLDLGDKPLVIGANGYVTLPLIGRVKAGGLTVEDLESDLVTRLKTYIQDPQVSLTVVDFRSQPISVFGAVANPGVLQLRGRKTLYEILSMAGGPRDTSGSTVSITRVRQYGPIPLPGAALDPTGHYYTAELNIREILSGKNMAANIDLQPYDVVVVSEANASVVYVVGDVQRAGAFTLGVHRSLSVLSALSLAGGLGRTAQPEHAKIFRPLADDQSKHQEIAINLKQILAGKQENIALRADDVLVIPTSGRRVFTTYVIPSVMASAVGAAIYGGVTH